MFTFNNFIFFMSCKVLIYSKYPLVEIGLSLFVANKISKIQISKKLSLSMPAISTYKMRILKKTNTNNLVDLTKSLYNIENTAFK